MHAQPERTSSVDLAGQANELAAGLGILTMAVFPFALPALLLVIAPVAVLALAGALLAAPLVLPVWLARVALRARGDRRARFAARAPEAGRPVAGAC